MDFQHPAPSSFGSEGRKSSLRARIKLPVAVRAGMEEAACRQDPDEACGLLLGRWTREHVDVVAARECANLVRVRARDRYVLDPVDHLAAEEDARSRGLEVVGVWHSHPDQPAHPSEIDRRGAWAGWSYVIVGVSRGVVTDLRSWRLVDGVFEEELVG